MKILPAFTKPWDRTLQRNHRPAPRDGKRGYRGYRPCLRWEFGFSCAFCLGHEADFVVHGTEGAGVTQIEHFQPISHAPEGRNDYGNCFYICRFCNIARGNKPVKTEAGVRLLNPCVEIWSEHFVIAQDRLQPQKSEDANYTHTIYDLDDPRKVTMRRHRRNTIEECLKIVEKGPDLRDRLLERAVKADRPQLVEEARLVDRAIRLAWRDLIQFSAVPTDADVNCACEDGLVRCRLPDVLENQLVEVQPPDTVEELERRE